MNLALHYLLTNVWTSMDVHTKVFIIIGTNIVGFYLLIILTFLYLILTRGLINKRVDNTINHIVIALIILASLAYGFSMAIWASSSKISPWLWIHKTFISIPLVISLIATIILFLNTRGLKLKSQVRPLKIFSLVYTVIYAYQLFLWLFPIEIWIIVSPFNLLVLNIIPIPFLAGFLQEKERLEINKPGTREKIDKFYQNHGLSKREMEIADLIVAGKSNEEIEDELFISIATVKKHISNIFLKMAVNSRSQLINLVFRSVLDD
jgi:DNA-binding CsgD family transcriptional regulator